MGKVLAWLGGTGAVVGLTCCVTAILPIALTALGASGLIGALYRDAVLLPFAGFSLTIMGAGLWLMRKSN